MRRHSKVGSRIRGIAALVAASCVTFVAAGSTSEATFGTDRFVAGDEVTLLQALEGDAFVAARHVRVAAPVAGDAVLTGGRVDVSADVGDDLYAAAGSVRIGSRIAGNARIAGGRVDLDPRSHIEGSATLTGGRIGVAGAVGRGLQVFAQRVVVDGAVGGDVAVTARELVIGPNAHIDGELRYRGPGEPAISPGSEIMGGIVSNGIRDPRDYDDGSWDSSPAGFVLGVGRFFWGLGIFALGSVMVLLMPAFTRTTTSMAGREPLSCIGIGLALLLAVPLAILFLFLTLVGIPLGLATMFGYGLLVMLGYMTGALFVGDWSIGRFSPGKLQSPGARILALFGALLLIAFLRHVPVAGPLAITLLFLAGLGAWTRSVWRTLRPPRVTTTA